MAKTKSKYHEVSASIIEDSNNYSAYKSQAVNKIDAKKARVKARVIELEQGEKLVARDYSGCHVYLTSGDAELHRPGLIIQLLKSNNKWQANDNVFNNGAHDSYVRCNSKCQFMVLPKKDANENGNVINSERLFTHDINGENKKETRDDLRINTIINYSDNNISKSQNLVEVSIYDLDKEYEDTVELPPEVNAELSIKIEKIAVEKQAQKMHEIYKLDKSKIKRRKISTRKIGNLLSGKVSDVMNSIADKIDANLTCTDINKNDSGALFSEIGYWKALKMGSPYKNGVYYVSDGIKVKTTYFTKNKNMFHAADGMTIKFWSSKKVDLNK